jgi:ribosomal protein S13
MAAYPPLIKPLTSNDTEFVQLLLDSLSQKHLLSFAVDIRNIYENIGGFAWNVTGVRKWIASHSLLSGVAMITKDGGLYYLAFWNPHHLVAGLLHYYKLYRDCLKVLEKAEQTSHLWSIKAKELQQKEKVMSNQMDELTDKLERQHLVEGELEMKLSKVKDSKRKQKEYSSSQEKEDVLRVRQENYECNRKGQLPKTIDLASRVYHSGGSAFGAHRVHTQVNTVAQHITDNSNVLIAIPQKTTVLSNIVHLDKINFYSETTELRGKKVVVHFDGSPINGMELLVVIVNWVNDNEFKQTTLPPIHLLSKESKEICSSVNILLQSVGVLPIWYASDSENTTGASICKLNKLRKEGAKQIRCVLHGLNNIVKKASKTAFGETFFSEIEKICNFIRTHWNKINSAIHELEFKLRRPVKALDIRWLTHLLAASYIFQSSARLVQVIKQAWKIPSKTAKEVLGYLQQPSFLLQCGVFEAFGSWVFLPIFHWVQGKEGRRIAEFPQKVREWLYLFGLLIKDSAVYFEHIFELAGKHEVNSTEVQKWIDQFSQECKKETTRWFSDYFQPSYVVAEVVCSPKLAQEYIKKYNSLSKHEQKAYNAFGLFSDQGIYRALIAWSNVTEDVKLSEFVGGKALWKWYLENYSIVVIHNAPCERAFSILNAWFQNKYVFSDD